MNYRGVRAILTIAVATVALGGCGLSQTIPFVHDLMHEVTMEPSSTLANYKELDSKVKIAPPDEGEPRHHSGRNGELTEEEMNMARIAWQYFENNYQPTTGMVNAVNKYPSTTFWDMGSYLGALVAAYELEIINKEVFDRRIRTLWKTLNGLTLFRNELPNKVYHTKTGEQVTYANKPGEIGYSALDLGRFLIWSEIIKERYPEHSNAVDSFVLRWQFCNVVKDGMLWGSYVDKQTNETKYVQEGRLGYEEYAAKGLQLWGFDPWKAALKDPFEKIPLYGVQVPYDSRDPRMLKAHNYVVTESYVLDGIELGWDLAHDIKSSGIVHTDHWAADMAQNIYKVQENRFKATGILTARTEHQLDRSPYFVYDTIYTDGYPWNTITEAGKYVPEFAAVAVKGAMGLWVLWDTPYTDILFQAVVGANDPQKGFYEGIYENGKGMINAFTANNNGILLASLLYKAQGKLLRSSNRISMWDRVLENPFNDPEKCLPTSPLECARNGNCPALQERLRSTSK